MLVCVQLVISKLTIGKYCRKSGFGSGHPGGGLRPVCFFAFFFLLALYTFVAAAVAAAVFVAAAVVAAGGATAGGAAANDVAVVVASLAGAKNRAVGVVLFTFICAC